MIHDNESKLKIINEILKDWGGMMENEYLIRVKLHKKAGKGIIESILDDIKRDDCVIESCIVHE